MDHQYPHIYFLNGSGKNTVEFLGFLAQLAQEYHWRPCVVVLDNVSYYTATIVKRFLAELSGRFEPIRLPPYCPELNDIECIWRCASLANYDFGGLDNLCQAFAQVFKEFNRNANYDLTLRFREPLSK